MKKGDRKERKKKTFIVKKMWGYRKRKEKLKYILNLYKQRRIETERQTEQYILFSQSLSNKIQF